MIIRGQDGNQAAGVNRGGFGRGDPATVSDGLAVAQQHDVVVGDFDLWHVTQGRLGRL
jgi:hypothetical protein